MWVAFSRPNHNRTSAAGRGKRTAVMFGCCSCESRLGCGAGLCVVLARGSLLAALETPQRWLGDVD